MTQTSSPVVSSSLTQKVQDAAQGLGALCLWELSDTKVTPADLRAILAAEGIQIEVPEIDPESAIKRAARTWSMGRGNDAKYRADIVDVGDPTKIKVCILRRQEEGDKARKAAKWETVEAAIFDLHSRTWTWTATTPEVRSFVDLADSYLKFLDHNFIRPNVIQKRLEEMRAFSLKASSGLWYVTQDQMGDLAALQRVVGAIGSSAMHVIHVGATDSSRSAIQSAARNALQETLEELEKKLEFWLESTRKIRTDAIDTTLEEFASLIERADLYQGALQVRMEDLTARINSARDRARQIIDGNLHAHENPATKPLGKRALQILEVIEAAYQGQTFTVRALEDLVGASAGTLQTHLRGLTRMGKVHRKGRDEQGAILFALGAAANPEAEAEESMEDEAGSSVVVEEAPSAPAEEVKLAPAKVPASAQVQETTETQDEVVVEEAPEAVQAPEAAPEAPEAQEAAPEADQEEQAEEPAAPSAVALPVDEELEQMDRDALRTLARRLREESGIEIPRASKLGRLDLARAIAAIRDGEAALA